MWYRPSKHGGEIVHSMWSWLEMSRAPLWNFSQILRPWAALCLEVMTSGMKSRQMESTWIRTEAPNYSLTSISKSWVPSLEEVKVRVHAWHESRGWVEEKPLADALTKAGFGKVGWGFQPQNFTWNYRTVSYCAPQLCLLLYKAHSHPFSMVLSTINHRMKPQRWIHSQMDHMFFLSPPALAGSVVTLRCTEQSWPSSPPENGQQSWVIWHSSLVINKWGFPDMGDPQNG